MNLLQLKNLIYRKFFIYKRYRMIRIGINGFGRIGKCIFLQLLDNKNFDVCCLNATGLKIDEIEDYLRYDSTHNYNKNFSFFILSNNEFQINHHKVKLFSDRNPSNLLWKDYSCEYLFDCTGAFLTTEKCNNHNIDYIIMSAPPKDIGITPTFIYGVNDFKYNGEKIISGSSCTTNAISPLLKILSDNFGIDNCVFTTIHSATASQHVVDSCSQSTRSKRGLMGNIIPHTTGASSSINTVIPELTGKVNGTCLRVPVLNCSLLDINIELNNKNVTLDDIKNLIESSNLYKDVFGINTKKLISCDFTTTTTPTILDIDASMDLSNGKFKLMVWYDNEWSYSSQLIKLASSIANINSNNKFSSIKAINKKKYLINNIHNSEFTNKKVVLRLDLNVTMNNEKIIDDFRITSAVPTIKEILIKNPEYLIITSHFGRPAFRFNNENSSETKDYSLKTLLKVLEDNLGQSIEFLPNGVSEETVVQISESKSKIFLLENLRYYDEETNYNKNSEIAKIYESLGNIFICDAFGCVHRKHMSIYGIGNFNKEIGYGYLIDKETRNLDKLIQSNKKILCIIGGNKISDKLPIVELFSKVSNAKIFVAGKLAKEYESSKSNIYVMKDGWGSPDLNQAPMYIESIKNTNYNTYDIGCKSKERLLDMIKDADVIFWNGSLGVIEHEFYRKSSIELIDYLETLENKTIIMGGGETASLIFDKNSKIYVSTGGGAMLDYLQKKLSDGTNPPGLEIFE
jgi:glyceraldehyde 3-phosphate dehydrogenase